MSEQETICRRKERRFKTSDDQSLLCDTAVHEEDVIQGTVIDISSSGLRLLCEGNFKVGQTFTTELKTDRSHGTYGGVIRRVEPWMGGKFVLGCQLLDTIPDSVLETLSHEGVVNRRRDDRVQWNQAAKISWELQPGETDIQIQDCSPGGLKLSSAVPLPDDLRLRIRVDVSDDEQMVVDAKTIWQREQEDGVQAGLAFTKREIPDAIMHVLGHGQSETDSGGQPAIRPSLLIAAAVVLLAVSLLQTGWLG